MVTTQGFNALLKLVEEPPEFLVFIFATTEPDKVLPTIRSRTHHYPFRLVPPTTLRGLLERICAAEGVTVEPTVLPAGGPRRRRLGPRLAVDPRPAARRRRARGRHLRDARSACSASPTTRCSTRRSTRWPPPTRPRVFRAVDRVVEAGHDPRRFATDLLDRLRDLIVLDAVPEAGGNGLLDCPPDRLDLMSSQAQALGSATLSRMADTVHDGLTEMRGTTAPRLLLELRLRPHAAARHRRLRPRPPCSGWSGWSGGCRSPASTPAGRPAEAPREAARRGTSRARQAPPRQPGRERPPAEPAREPPPRGGAGRPAAPAGTSRAGLRAAVPRAAEDRPAAAPRPRAGRRRRDAGPRRCRRDRAAGTAPPAASRRSAGAPARRRAPAPAAAGEPDIPLPPEPTDDEDWPHPAEPAAARAAAARTDGGRARGAAASPPRAAAESAPAPRGGEPTPLVSADPPRAADGELTTTDVRRVWPELLAVVKRHKRTTEALLKNAQVHQLSNGVLTLSTSSPALARRLRRRPEQGRHPRGAQRAARRPLAGRRRRRGRGRAGRRRRWPRRRPASAAQAAEAARGQRAHGRAGRRVRAVRTATDEPAVDPEQAALSLLRAQLGARPVDS